MLNANLRKNYTYHSTYYSNIRILSYFINLKINMFTFYNHLSNI
jgi:hypothetical protein